MHVARLNFKLFNIYEKETASQPTYLKNGMVMHTIKYVNWLESIVEKSINKTENNMEQSGKPNAFEVKG